MLLFSQGAESRHSELVLRSEFVSQQPISIHKVRGVLFLPALPITGRKRPRVIHADRDLHLAARPDVESQAGKGLTAAGQNEHHGPLCLAEYSGKGFFIGPTRRRAIARMRVNPYATELLRLATQVDLPVKEIGHGLILERDGDRCATLANHLHVFDKQQIVGRRDGEAADLGPPTIPQVD